jgi:hypothetical protein
MATRIEMKKKVEPRRTLWWSGIAKRPVRVATAAAAVRRAAVLVRSGRVGQNCRRPANAELPDDLLSSAVCGRSVTRVTPACELSAGAVPRRRGLAGRQGPRRPLSTASQEQRAPRTARVRRSAAGRRAERSGRRPLPDRRFLHSPGGARTRRPPRIRCPRRRRAV